MDVFFDGKVVAIKPIHKLAARSLWEVEKTLPKRWVIWSVVDSEYRLVWLRIVEDDSDALPLRQRSLLVKTFFEQLVDQKIQFSEKRGDWYKECYSVEGGALPELYQVDSFSNIYEWFKKNRPECLENDLKVLREKKAKAVAATKKKNIAELERRRQNAPKLTFTRGLNPRYGTEQWEARKDGRLFILRREDYYDLTYGPVPIEETFDLVPGRITLVKRV